MTGVSPISAFIGRAGTGHSITVKSFRIITLTAEPIAFIDANCFFVTIMWPVQAFVIRSMTFEPITGKTGIASTFIPTWSEFKIVKNQIREINFLLLMINSILVYPCRKHLHHNYGIYLDIHLFPDYSGARNRRNQIYIDRCNHSSTIRTELVLGCTEHFRHTCAFQRRSRSVRHRLKISTRLEKGSAKWQKWGPFFVRSP